ncbi:MAG: hypothetical protein HKO59_01905 [Phycisphaerales bacterium]|nr:hypothetical protein [Phycisphaerae bacterium]NNM24736.1 hypothetical protein [Phycisphaerales bacterium]
MTIAPRNAFVAAIVAWPLASTAADYARHAELKQQVSDLSSEYADARSVMIGTSHEGREIPALVLARAGAVDPARRPALLLVANIDGDHVVGSAVALEVAQTLLAHAQEGNEAAVDLLTNQTVYVVPRVNPDAAERFFAGVRDDRRRNARADDADRDGQLDEDPANDLNGDGLITMMRVYDPEKATHRADPDEPRLDAKPDRDKGERAEFYLVREGVDDDGDGKINEDELGGVDLNRNFMHGFKEHADGTGRYPLSEPESHALLTFVLEHQNIAAVVVYGRHDNLITIPDGKGRDPAGAPKNIEEEDVGLYKQIGERFKELTDTGSTPKQAADGAFFAWAYAQFGVPAFSTPLYARPEPQKDDAEEADDEDGGAAGDEGEEADAEGGGTPSGIGDIAQETIDALRAAAEGRGFEVTDEMLAQVTPDQIEQFAKQMGVEVMRAKEDDAGNGGSGGKKKGGDSPDAKWLVYSDGLAEPGFVAWQPFDHPELGRVEIGGWKPYFKSTPPFEAVAELAEKQLAFLLDLADRMPSVSLTTPEVTRLAPGLYEVKAALVNDGYLPTGTAMAVRNRRARPHVVRLELPRERFVTGQRVQRVWSVPGSGGRVAMRWIVEADDDADVAITVYSEKYGRFEVPVSMTDTNGGGS